MSILSEFKEFAVKGNMIDMAVGIIIGGAFGKIVSSLVQDIIMPPIGMLIGGIDFSGLALTLQAASEGSPAVTINYGQFIQHAISFLIVAWAVFILVKSINSLKRKEEEAAPEPEKPGTEVALLTEIRDALQSR